MQRPEDVHCLLLGVVSWRMIQSMALDEWGCRTRLRSIPVNEACIVRWRSFRRAFNRLSQPRRSGFTGRCGSRRVMRGPCGPFFTRRSRTRGAR